MLPRRRSVETVPVLTTNRFSSFHAYGHVLVPGEHEMDAGALQALDRVAGVVDDVPLAAGAGDRQQVVVQHEDAQVGRLAANCSSIQP